MQQKNIEPHKVTKPIQLLAAWLAGLVLVNGTFLGAAIAFDAGSIERTWLTIASVINVPLFLGAIFLLQTKFRPELQEDSYYSSYLDKKTQRVTELKPIDEIRAALNALKHDSSFSKNKAVEAGEDDDTVELDVSIALSDKLPEMKSIRTKLRKFGINDIRLFDPEASGEKPIKQHITINPSLPFFVKLEILSIGANSGFDSYSYDEPNSVNTEDVYLGGYGYGRETDNYVFGTELLAVLNGTPKIGDLIDYEMDHKIS